MKRLFIAVSLNEENRILVGRVLKELEKYSLHAKIEPIENVHLTLKFLGNTMEDKIDLISKRLSEVVSRHDRFNIKLDGYGFFPNEKNPRIFWLGVEDVDRKLVQLQKDIEEAMYRIGYEREGKPFKSHITLARIKSNKDIIRLVEGIKVLSEIKFEPMQVKYIVLYESILKPSGAEYHSLKQYYLQGEE
jgi:2'-5' RNA ligase